MIIAMLSMLYIENIAVIEKANIDFDVGFTVMTGETGAGKSIVIDAISAVLGERTSRDLIRTGAASALVTAMFSSLPESVSLFLTENGMPAENNECLIQREIFSDGRNSCRINGRPATVSFLKSLGSRLINIHGQHDSQQLLNDSCHLAYLDSFAANAGLFEQYRLAYAHLLEIRHEMDGLALNDAEKSRRIDLLKYTIDEIDSAQLQDGEEEALLVRRTLLKSAGRITQALQTACFLFSGDEESSGVCSQLTEAYRQLSATAALSAELSGLSARVGELSVEAEDVSAEIRGFRDSLDFSPDELDTIEGRLDCIYKLKCKYGSGTGEILRYLDKCRAELEGIEFSEERLEKLKNEYHTQMDVVLKLAAKLTQSRKQAAALLETRILQELSQLDMQKIRFFADFAQTDENISKPGLTGVDDVRFLIATNLGEPLKPMSRIASGGELARIMLALKNVLAENDEVATLVFDEVDSGVSGRAAQRVAEKLSDVAGRRQVLCVTHLPQIAAMGDTHFLIAKGEEGGRTVTHVEKLGFEERKKEIARITGGAHITEVTLQSAAELLSYADNHKNGRGITNNDLI